MTYIKYGLNYQTSPVSAVREETRLSPSAFCANLLTINLIVWPVEAIYPQTLSAGNGFLDL
jgi:hypothetical protein